MPHCILAEELENVDGILLRTANLSSNVLSGCHNLKIVARHGVGYDNVDLEYLNQNEIALGITGTSNAVSVAEHVLTSFLYLTKNIHLSDKLTREGKFNEKSSFDSAFSAILAAPVLILNKVLAANEIPSGNIIRDFPFLKIYLLLMQALFQSL